MLAELELTPALLLMLGPVMAAVDEVLVRSVDRVELTGREYEVVAVVQGVVVVVDETL